MAPLTATVSDKVPNPYTNGTFQLFSIHKIILMNLWLEQPLDFTKPTEGKYSIPCFRLHFYQFIILVMVVLRLLEAFIGNMSLNDK